MNPKNRQPRCSLRQCSRVNRADHHRWKKQIPLQCLEAPHHAKTQTIFTESVGALAELTAELHDQYKPADSTERFLVDTLVNNEWRLWQSAIDRFIENHTETQAATPADAFQASNSAFERLQRVINSCKRNYHRALKELKALAAAGNTPQPEEAKTTSESVSSFRTKPNVDLETAANSVTPAPDAPFSGACANLNHPATA
jgi:hypothetical protein